MKRILFYECPYYFFSNFSSHAVVYEDILYPTAEHAYQSSKFDDDKIKEEIRSARSSQEAKNIANNKYKKYQRVNWGGLKVQAMHEIVKEKVLQHEEIKKALLNTGTAEIIENSPVDYFWGCGKDNTGQNQLGKILMKIRKELL